MKELRYVTVTNEFLQNFLKELHYSHIFKMILHVFWKKVTCYTHLTILMSQFKYLFFNIGIQGI